MSILFLDWLMFCVSLLLRWFCWVGPRATVTQNSVSVSFMASGWKANSSSWCEDFSFLWVYNDSEQHSPKEGVPCSCPPLITGSDCYTGLVVRFLGLPWTSVFVVLLVNQWTQTLQSRATFIRLDLLVLNDLFPSFSDVLQKLQLCICKRCHSFSPKGLA